MKKLLFVCALCWGCDESEPIEGPAPDMAPLPDMALPDPDGPAPDAVADGAVDDAAPDMAAPDGAIVDAAADSTADAAVDAADLDAGGQDAGADGAIEADAGADIDPVDAGPDGPEPDAPPPPPNVDIMVDWSCRQMDYAPGECVDGEGIMEDGDARNHVSLPELIEYESNPPAIGPHRPSWGRWGEYEFMPPQRWLHNLEHGGIAFLYHPCAPQETIDALRDLARARPEDDVGPFRWVLTPHIDLPSTVAVVAWGWAYSAECVDEALITDFIDRFYRMGPEDVRSDGRYNELWIGR